MKYILLILSLACILYWGSVEAETEVRTVKLTLVKEAKSKCGFHEGCATLGENSCEIIAPEPKDYLDHWRLEILGHELWHCFNDKTHVNGRAKK